ncbi:uncharacterized protein EV154DRAFT_411515 [Mucor mucedo]|uniref:uncharacterized protein n=1 Tax=Mucor mucedo TaxID=29922 RepID=UPI002220AF32|nr:uncharacterized protein EV154DRAFT_411515 [Mucor mucedo]KAI7896387.1 hypothetical protein EV154DRAFT_411515 [Mucor mucedo]
MCNKSENSPIELALLQINTFKSKFLRAEGRATEGYIMLKIMDYILETLEDWKQDDSENTIYRRIATVFDFMFRNTHVKLAEKIDLLIRYGKENKDLELSSIEFKKPSVTATIAIAQQCKNLGVNGVILNHLQRLNPKIDSIVAMDWIGSTGYMCCLFPHRGVYVPKLIDTLTIPTSINGVLDFENTLRLLFAFKVFPSPFPPKRGTID